MILFDGDKFKFSDLPAYLRCWMLYDPETETINLVPKHMVSITEEEVPAPCVHA